jgi:carbon storage regulator
MLVLRRKVGEAIVLNGVITVYVLAVEGERVKLGINAPPDVVIVRQELLDSVAQENRAARRQAQGGEGEAGGKPGHESPAEGGTGRRDLRAMLDRALSNPDGTLSPHGMSSPRNGYVTEPPDGPRAPVHQRQRPVKPEGDAQGTEDEQPL